MDLLLEEELEYMHDHGHYILEYGTRQHYEKYKNECRRSEVLGSYLARRGLFHTDHLIDSIVLKTLSNCSIYEGSTNMYTALRTKTKEKHKIQVNTSTAIGSEVCYKDIEAYHLSLFDLYVLERMLAFEELYRDKSEGSYELIRYTGASEILFNHCNSSEYIGVSTTIVGNRFDSNCDTYGTVYGYPAQEAYIFWLADTREYAVVYHSYWM